MRNRLNYTLHLFPRPPLPIPTPPLDALATRRKPKNF